MPTTSFDQIKSLSQGLSPHEKLRLIDDLVHQLLHEGGGGGGPYRSFWGALADLGAAPSAEEIDAMRREAFSGFPRQDDVR